MVDVIVLESMQIVPSFSKQRSRSPSAYGEIKGTWNNQLPYIEQNVKGLFIEIFWTYKRLGMCVWEIQTDPLQRVICDR